MEKNVQTWIERFVDTAWHFASTRVLEGQKDGADRMSGDGFDVAFRAGFQASFGRPASDAEGFLQRLLMGRRQHTYLVARGRDSIGFWYDEGSYPNRLAVLERRLQKAGVKVPAR